MQNCPSGCFPSCYASSQCQQVAPRMVCIHACCCPATTPTNIQPIFNPGSINIIPIPVPIGPSSHSNLFSLSSEFFPNCYFNLILLLLTKF